MPTDDMQWEDARRIEAWAGEVRVNLIRLVAILGFYGHHLVNVYLLRDDPTVAGRFHAAVTALVLAWSAMVLALYFCLSRRWLPPWLMYATAAWDIVLVTALLMLTGDPRTSLATLFFLVIATAPLRLSLPLVYAATLGAMLAATVMMGGYVFGVVGTTDYYDPSKGYQVPRTSEVIFLLALGAAGLLAGQVVRQARRVAEGYPVRVVEEREAA